MKRRQTAERQRKALVVSSGPSFASAGGMSGTGGISSFEAAFERLKEHLDAIVSGL